VVSNLFVHGPDGRFLKKSRAGFVFGGCFAGAGYVTEWAEGTSGLKCLPVDQSMLLSQNDVGLHAFSLHGTSPDFFGHFIHFRDYFWFRKSEVYYALVTQYTLSVCLAMTAVPEIIVRGCSWIVYHRQT